MSKLFRKIVSLLAVTVISITMTASFASPAVTVYADDYYDGTEIKKATVQGNFTGPVEQNKYKIWSILRTYGLTEYEAAGVMGCWKCECEFKPELVEANPRITVTDGVPTATVGSQYDDTFDAVNDYIANCSAKYIECHDAMTVACLCDGWHCWGDDANQNQWGIEQARLGVDFTDNGIAEAFYFSVGGQGYCGIGLAQWTADRAVGLLDWCNKHNCEWWVLESQIMFTMSEDGDSGFSYWEEYKEKWKDSTDLNEITKDFSLNFEGNTNEDYYAPRQEAAQAIYNEFAGSLYDFNYAYDVLADTDMVLPPFVREDIIDRSIFYYYIGKNLIYPQNSGFIFESTNVYVEDENGNLTIADSSLQSSQNAKNVNVLTGYVNQVMGNGNNSPEYCLFELFGENLHWYRYLGEKTYSPKLADHIWSAWTERRLNKLGVLETIMYSSTNYLSCEVYEGRPTVLSSSERNDGFQDPRTDLVGVSAFMGYTYEAGEINMTFAKYIVALISLLIGTEIPAHFTILLTKFETTDAWNTIKIAVNLILAFAMVAFIFSLVKKVFQYSKGTGSSPKDVIERFIIGVIALGLLFLSVNNPSVMNNTIYRGLTAIDQLFNYALNKTCEDDEVIHCSDENMQVHACLWRTAIFQPWCRGQFSGLDYEKLYTHYATLQDGQSVMPQSHQTIDPADTSGNPFFDSAKYTGDVYVPIGGGKEVRNWAAYLMSCGSKYHIDNSVKNVSEAGEFDLSQPIYFPNATTTAYDSTLMADTYRVIDAQFNISPQQYPDGTIANNYTDASIPNTHYFKEGNIMLCNALMLFIMLPTIWAKIKNFFLLLLTMVQMIWFTILELFKEQKGLSAFTGKIGKCLIDYVLANIKLVIMVMLYMALVDKGFVLGFVYILACLTIQAFKYEEAKQDFRNVKNNINRAKNWASREIAMVRKPKA
jgi:hypothetical protein